MRQLRSLAAKFLGMLQEPKKPILRVVKPEEPRAAAPLPPWFSDLCSSASTSSSVPYPRLGEQPSGVPYWGYPGPRVVGPPKVDPDADHRAAWHRSRYGPKPVLLKGPHGVQGYHDGYECECSSYDEHKAQGYQCTPPCLRTEGHQANILAKIPPKAEESACPYLAAMAGMTSSSFTSSAYGGHLPSTNLASLPSMDSETYDVITDMEADEYQSEALKTAMCPVIGHPIIYPLLGIVGEMGEVLDKIHFYNAPGHTPPWQGSSRGDITKELGDVLWYSSVLADRLGYKLSEVIGFKFLNAYQKSLGITRPLDDRIGLLPAAENQFVSAVGKLSERVKKVFRDNDATFDDGCKTDLMKLLAEVLATLAILSKTLNIEFSVVGRINIDKLLSRRARNKIQGDGDDR